MQLKTSRNQLKSWIGHSRSAVTCCLTIFTYIITMCHIYFKFAFRMLSCLFIFHWVATFTSIKVQTGQIQTYFTSLPVLFFVVNHQLLQFCHIHPSNVSHFLAFQVLYLSVHIPLPVQTSCSKSDSSELSARSAVVVSAASNDQPMSNDQPNEPQRDVKPVSFVTGAMLFLLVPLLFFCCCFCQQQ